MGSRAPNLVEPRRIVYAYMQASVVENLAATHAEPTREAPIARVVLHFHEDLVGAFFQTHGHYVVVQAAPPLQPLVVHQISIEPYPEAGVAADSKPAINRLSRLKFRPGVTNTIIMAAVRGPIEASYRPGRRRYFRR